MSNLTPPFEHEEVSPRVEEWAEQFRAEMSDELRGVVLENLPDFLDALDPGTAGDDENREAFALALAEFRADLVQNPHAFDRAPRATAKGGEVPNTHIADAEALLATLNGFPPGSPERASVAAEVQAHALLSIARRPSGLGLNVGGSFHSPGPGSPW